MPSAVPCRALYFHAEKLKQLLPAGTWDPQVCPAGQMCMASSFHAISAAHPAVGIQLHGTRTLCTLDRQDIPDLSSLSQQKLHELLWLVLASCCFRLL